MLTIVRGRLEMQFADNPSLDEGRWAAFGGEVLGASETQILVQAVLALGFFVIAIMAWRGQPPVIRWVFVFSVIILSAGNIGLLLSSLAAPSSIETGIDSGTEIVRSVATTQLCITVAIPIYVIWYMNRAPARAFYRGRQTNVRNSQSSDQSCVR